MNPLDHRLQPFLQQLAQANSSRDLARLPLFRRLRPEIDRVLEAVLCENRPVTGRPPLPHVRATAWNIERGIELEGITDVLKTHPRIRHSDLLLLTELDYGMARSGNRRIPSELAASLEFSYAFAPSYLNLEKGSGLEVSVEGANSFGLHGNAIFSRYPIREPHSIALPNGKDKMRGKEKRLGCQRAVVGLIDHPHGAFRAVSVHLDAHSSQKHRMYQMRLILDDLDRFHRDLPALIGGDWNTSTYNSRNALFSILGYSRRVLMGVRHVIKNHYPHPDRWFERHLFRELERRGYRYRDLNAPGACTLHYNVNDLAANGRMADWIPNWCFWFIKWALARNEGWCSLKLDWFAGRGVRPVADYPPGVAAEVHSPSAPLSDHDPILVDFALTSERRRRDGILAELPVAPRHRAETDRQPELA
jgi:endonuclease/exonuclease/phosphatase family metal-dependent hydrolase